METPADVPEPHARDGRARESCARSIPAGAGARHNSLRRIIYGLCFWACAYIVLALIGMVITGLRRSFANRRARNIETKDAAQVEWLLSPRGCVAVTSGGDGRAAGLLRGTAEAAIKWDQLFRHQSSLRNSFGILASCVSIVASIPKFVRASNQASRIDSGSFVPHQGQNAINWTALLPHILIPYSRNTGL